VSTRRRLALAVHDAGGGEEVALRIDQNAVAKEWSLTIVITP